VNRSPLLGKGYHSYGKAMFAAWRRFWRRLSRQWTEIRDVSVASLMTQTCESRIHVVIWTVLAALPARITRKRLAYRTSRFPARVWIYMVWFLLLAFLLISYSSICTKWKLYGEVIYAWGICASTRVISGRDFDYIFCWAFITETDEGYSWSVDDLTSSLFTRVSVHQNVV
jgi:hypothetical protein